MNALPTVVAAFAFLVHAVFGAKASSRRSPSTVAAAEHLDERIHRPEMGRAG